MEDIKVSKQISIDIFAGKTNVTLSEKQAEDLIVKLQAALSMKSDKKPGTNQLCVCPWCGGSKTDVMLVCYRCRDIIDATTRDAMHAAFDVERLYGVDGPFKPGGFDRYMRHVAAIKSNYNQTKQSAPKHVCPWCKGERFEGHLICAKCWNSLSHDLRTSVQGAWFAAANGCKAIFDKGQPFNHDPRGEFDRRVAGVKTDYEMYMRNVTNGEAFKRGKDGRFIKRSKDLASCIWQACQTQDETESQD